ncbi:MAG TPA: VOC family protein [Pseudonocardiaceae bacterium]|nr:VOC family protein [Pseudonocardiaceae bacterium]
MTWAGSTMAFVGVSDLDRAERFYGETLGLELDDQRPFALVAQVGGTELRITAVEQVRAAPYTVLGWGVADIDATVDLLTLRGIEFTRYEGMEQDARGIWTSPSAARIAWFLDPDGNNLSLTQFS